MPHMFANLVHLPQNQKKHLTKASGFRIIDFITRMRSETCMDAADDSDTDTITLQLNTKGLNRHSLRRMRS